MPNKTVAVDLKTNDKGAPGIRSYLGGINKVADRVQGLNTNFAALAGVGGVAGLAAAGVASFSALYSAQAPVIDRLGKVSESTGIATTALQGLFSAGGKAGVEDTVITDALKTIAERLGEAEVGSGTAFDAFAKLNLPFEDLIRLSPEERYLSIAEAISSIEDPAKKASLANQLLGGAGFEAMRVTRAGVDSAIEKFREMDTQLTESNVAGVERLNDKFQDLRETFSSSQQVFTAEIAPSIEAVIETFFDLQSVQQNVRGASADMADTFRTAIGAMGDGVNNFRKGLLFIEYGFQNILALNAKIVDVLVPFAGYDLEVDRYLNEAEATFQRLADLELNASFSERLETSFANIRAQIDAEVAEIEKRRAAIGGDSGIGGTSGPTDAETKAAEKAAKAKEAREKEFASIKATAYNETEALVLAAQQRIDRLDELRSLDLGNAAQYDSAKLRLQVNLDEKLAELDARKAEEQSKKFEARSIEIETIRSSLLTEEELRIESFTRTVERLDELRLEDAANEDTYLDLRAQAAQNFAAKELEIYRKKEEEKQKLQAAGGKALLDLGDRALSAFADRSEDAEKLSRYVTAARMAYGAGEAIMNAYAFGAKIGGPVGGGIAAGAATLFSAALIANTLQGGGRSPSASGGGDGGLSGLSGQGSRPGGEVTVDRANLAEDRQPQVVYNAYFVPSDTTNRESRAAAQLAEDVRTKRIVLRDGQEPLINTFDHEEAA